MSDTINLLKERLEKANAKVVRHEKALEAAKNERSDIHTTLRVLADLSGESEEKHPSESGVIVSERQNNILQILPVGRENARSPSDLHAFYSAIFGEISIDVFRTTIWRMAKSDNVSSENGKYWKEASALPVSEPLVGMPPSVPDAEGWSMQASRPYNAENWERDDDSEVPF